jgi:hypothetical protein
MCVGISQGMMRRRRVFAYERHQAILRIADPIDQNCPEVRAVELLKENLSETQLKQYEQHRHFDVIGGQSGKRYRIRPGASMNIDEYDADGRLVTSWCFVPEGPLGTGDVMLAQKFALELFETDALSIAGRARLVGTSSVRYRRP